MCTRGFGALTNILCRSARQTSLPKWWHRSVRVLPRRWFGQPAACTHPHLLQQGEVTPGITKQEYFTRRCRLMYKVMCAEGHCVSSRHIVIIPSATKQYMTEDIPYPFRQNSNFVYMCGFQEPDSILVMESGDAWPKHTATLFVPKKDPHKELWEGARSGTDGAIELTGVDSAYNIEDLGKYLQMYENTDKLGVVWYDSKNASHHVPHMKCVKSFVKKFEAGAVQNPNLLIQLLRVLKSPAEAALMQQSCDISSEAFKKVMAYSRPGVNEAHLYAKMDFECRVNGSEFLAYPPVVAGGNRANTIHYISNNQLVEDGEMVLMDAGGEYHGYASDITRTWPVSGKFTPAQRLLYEALLEVQLSCIEYLRNTRPVSVDTLYQHMLSELGQQLRHLTILPAHMSSGELAQASRRFCPHHVGHYLGMDVHDTDTLSRHVSLQDGMVITVEPGIYIPDTMKDVPAEFHGNGLRIEDDVLMTDAGPVVLSDKCPKHPDDIERYVSA